MSNYKTKQELDRCAYCDRSNVKLEKSHIIPKWSFKYLAEMDYKDHRLKYQTQIIFPSREVINKGNPKENQDTERILCRECESKFGKWEESLSFLTKTKKVTPYFIDTQKMGYHKMVNQDGIPEQLYVVDEIRSDSIMKALVGILYKYHYQNKITKDHHAKFSNRQVKYLKNYLSDCSSKRVSLIYAGKRFDFHRNKYGRPNRIHGHGLVRMRQNVFSIILGSWEFQLFVSNEKERKIFPSVIINETSILVRIQMFGVQKITNHLQDKNTFIPSYSVLNYCPCGAYESYGDCCKKTWFSFKEYPKNPALTQTINNAIKTTGKISESDSASNQARLVIPYGVSFVVPKTTAIHLGNQYDYWVEVFLEQNYKCEDMDSEIYFDELSLLAIKESPNGIIRQVLMKFNIGDFTVSFRQFAGYPDYVNPNSSNINLPMSDRGVLKPFGKENEDLLYKFINGLEAYDIKSYLCLPIYTEVI